VQTFGSSVRQTKGLMGSGSNRRKRWASVALVSTTNEDFPEPWTPVQILILLGNAQRLVRQVVLPGTANLDLCLRHEVSWGMFPYSFLATDERR